MYKRQSYNRLLSLFRTKRVDNPYLDPDKADQARVDNFDGAKKKAYEANQKAVVLVKNHEKLLPLAKSQKVCIVTFKGVDSGFAQMAQAMGAGLGNTDEDAALRKTLTEAFEKKGYTVVATPEEADVLYLHVLSLIHICVYSEINALLAGTADAETQAKYAEVLDQLPAMKELYAHRARLRKERGCIDFESGEVKLILDENGHCIDVKKRTSGESEAMIEEFMLLANQCAAHFARVKQIPFVYRVHEEPNGEKLERLHSLLQACGINDHFAKEVPTPKELSAILEGVRGTPFEQIVNTGMLRCMSKACYEEKPKGHYGLVLKDYAHFTSPIRRYPDLAIHRMMTDLLSGTDKETMIVRYTDFAEKASKQSSEREVLAVQIERKAEDYYKAEYARRHLGECYEGIISGVTQRGIFVELENGVEGFVPASSLTATGTTLTEGIRLSDPASGKTWSLGDSMMITIVRADINLGKVDFEVAPETK